MNQKQYEQLMGKRKKDPADTWKVKVMFFIFLIGTFLYSICLCSLQKELSAYRSTTWITITRQQEIIDEQKKIIDEFTSLLKHPEERNANKN